MLKVGDLVKVKATGFVCRIAEVTKVDYYILDNPDHTGCCTYYRQWELELIDD